MKEKHIKEIVQQSLMKTSEGFTDKLMHKIERRQAAVPVRVKLLPVVTAFLATGLLGILLSQLSWENSIFEGPLKRLFQAFLSLFLIFSFYKFYEIKTNLKVQLKLERRKRRENE